MFYSKENAVSQWSKDPKIKIFLLKLIGCHHLPCCFFEMIYIVITLEWFDWKESLALGNNNLEMSSHFPVHRLFYSTIAPVTLQVCGFAVYCYEWDGEMHSHVCNQEECVCVREEWGGGGGIPQNRLLPRTKNEVAQELLIPSTAGVRGT